MTLFWLWCEGNVGCLLYLFFFFASEKGKLFGMGDNRENQLGINQRGKSEEPVLQVVFPTRIHLSGHSKAAKPKQVSCGAFHTAVLTGQSNDKRFIITIIIIIIIAITGLSEQYTTNPAI